MSVYTHVLKSFISVAEPNDLRNEKTIHFIILAKTPLALLILLDIISKIIPNSLVKKTEREKK